jgi:hypothetical protein
MTVDSAKHCYYWTISLRKERMWKKFMLPALPYPELFFGLCSPLGVDNKKAFNILADTLQKYKYSSEYFKVTTLMKSIVLNDFELKESPLDERYDSYIKYANRIRELIGFPFALASLCCTAVRNFRRQKNGKADSYLPRTAYIFDQFREKKK